MSISAAEVEAMIIRESAIVSEVVESRTFTKVEKMAFLIDFAGSVNSANAHTSSSHTVRAVFDRINQMIVYLGGNRRDLIGYPSSVKRVSEKDKHALDAVWLPAILPGEKLPTDEASLRSCLTDTNIRKRPRYHGAVWSTTTRREEKSQTIFPERTHFDYTKSFPARAPRPKI